MTAPAYTFFKYFPITDPNRTWGFTVVSVGNSKIPPQHPYPPAKHPDDHNFTWRKGRILDTYTLVYIPNGSGTFESTESGLIRIEKNCLFIVYPHIWHRYRPDIQTGWDEYWIEMTGNTAERFMNCPEFDPGKPVINLRASDVWMDHFIQLVETARHEPQGFQYLLASHTITILAHLLANKGQEDFDNEKIQIINQAKATLIDRMTENIDLRELAEQLCVSYSWFRKHFKNHTGLSPRQYQLEFRFQRARELLDHTDLPVNQISDRLGFSSVFYFSQQFKQKTGFCPLKYRYRRKNQV